MSKILQNYLRPSATVCPKFYGLPKIHKPDVPLRPIVASIGSATHAMAKYLAEILKPIFGKSELHVVNSKEFVLKMEQIKLDANDILVSFDVVSLFTNLIEKTLPQQMTSQVVLNQQFIFCTFSRITSKLDEIQ